MGSGAPGQLYFGQYAQAEAPSALAPSLLPVVGSLWPPVAGSAWETVRGTRWGAIR
jgi:hypothetical protein